MNAADVIAEACETITDECVNRYPDQAVFILAELAREGFAVVKLPEFPGWGAYDGGVAVDGNRVNVYSDYSYLPDEARELAADVLRAADLAEEAGR